MLLFLRLALRELDSLRIKRLARLLLPEPVLLWPGSRGEDLLSSPEPLVSVISDGDRGVVAKGGVLMSRSLLVEERRLDILRRRAKPTVVCTEGGRDGDLNAAAAEAGDARFRLSVDGDLAPSRESRRSLMKSLTTDKDDRRLGRKSTSSSLPSMVLS